MNDGFTKSAMERTILSGDAIRLAEEPAIIGRPVALAKPAPKHEVKLELIREGDVVRVIELTCSCGEKHRIRCDFD
ncbi:MAG: hypothetical protein N2112_07235 [Gemmataceae bacterium]|jgi:hypothetical protein|nr:hypothetical protein [Gemmataceae bacterium]